MAATTTPPSSSPATDSRPAPKVLRRVFRMGVTQYVDLAEHLPPDQSLKLYEGSNPILKSCTLGESYVEGDLLVFPVERPPVQTKGAQ